ncbi:glycoside hydrolase family 6 protein, partial [Actinotalea sp. C106]|uniref:glycoside hydrolase family 6 protein n=1 Tax=Actinotalea sp. C106 TaxID=2908644 RepID=UPI002027FF09
TPAQYTAWTRAVAEGLAGARAVVVVEPDALLHVYRCGDSEARFDQIRDSARAYTAAGAEVYLDAGSSNSFNWGPATRADIASRLERAGIREVAGFATNVSNFQTTADERAYGDALSPLVGGARYVIDTSRNGQGGLRDAQGAVWCNPPGRGLGTPPAYVGSGQHVANLWIKTVGLSDGQCNGGPPAGRFWEEYALGLALRSAS